MNKILKLSGVSMLAVMATANANAAGYTCEELIEYTSCNTGYYLNAGDCVAGTSCGAGNYLVPSCQAGFEYVTEGCLWSDGIFESDVSPEDCEDDGRYYDTGHWCFGYIFDDDGSEYYGVVAANFDCMSCAAGTYQPSAGQYSCMTCPAGSECPTTTMATLCEYGEYSSAGATACSNCPETGMTDKDGATVVATTLSKGSTSLSQCVVGSEYNFTDTKGTYHYTSECEVFNPSGIKTEADCEWLAETTGEDWYWEEWSNYSVCSMTDGIWTPSSSPYEGMWTIVGPTTESECVNTTDAGTAFFYDGKCYCDGNRWSIVSGKLICDMV